MQQKLAVKRSFDSTGRLVEPGFPAVYADNVETGKNVVELGDFEPAVVEMSAIAPTGPRPTAPQQIAPDMIQTLGGYAKPGAVVVGEVARQDTLADAAREKEGDQTGEEDIANLMDTNNNDDALVDGTVKEITADLGSKTDEELRQLREAEADREAPRKGVISAIDKELKSREG